MASNKRTIHLGLDYSDFTGGISEVNRKMQLLDAEFKLASEQAKNYGNETDKLGLKHEYLTQRIALQNKKLEDAKKAYDAALVKGSKASQKEIDSLDKKLLQERITLEKLNGELKSSEKAIVRANEETRSFGDTIRNAASVIGVDVNPAVEALASKFDGVNASVGAAILTIGTIGTALVSFSMDLGKTAAELETLSAVTGLSTTELQKFQYASTELRVSTDSLSDGLKEITNKMREARNGSTDTQEAFKKLGIRFLDSKNQMKNSTDVFYEVIDALGRVKNETERNALAMQLFGESGRNLNPIIEAGSKRLRELGLEAEDLGLILSEDLIDSANDMNTAFEQAKDSFQATGQKLGAVLLPVLTTLFEVLSNIPVPVLVGITAFAALASIFTSLAKASAIMSAANVALAATNTAVATTGAMAAAALSPLLIKLLLIAAVVALFAGGVSGIVAGIKETSKAAEEAISKANTAAESTSNTLQKATTRSYRNNFIGNRNFEGGETWVGEDGPEIVELPRGSKIYSNQDSKSMGETVNYYNITISASDVKEFNDIVRIAQGQQQAFRRRVRKDV